MRNLTQNSEKKTLLLIVGIEEVAVARKKFQSKTSFPPLYEPVFLLSNSMSNLPFLVTFVTIEEKRSINVLINSAIRSVTNFEKVVSLLQFVTSCNNLLQSFVTLPITSSKYSLLFTYGTKKTFVTNVTRFQVATKSENLFSR